MIEFKGLREGIRWGSPREEILLVLTRLCEFSARQGITIRITSMNDHSHQKADPETGQRASLHYSDLALDCVIYKRDGTLHKVMMNKLVRYLRMHLLGGAYDIVYGSKGHHSHCHIEYDCHQRASKEPNV
jgi:hypothetical protein